MTQTRARKVNETESGPKRVALYARVSTEEQAQKGTSIESQLELLRAYAKAQGWIVCKEYVDRGLSGTTLERTGLTAMLAEARAGTCDVIAASKLDRFMRDTRLLLNVLNELKGAGVGFVAVSDGINTTDGRGDLVVTVLGAIGQFERERILERTHEGRRKTAQNGKLLSGYVPYGYRYVASSETRPARWEVDEAQAVVVRRIFQWVVTEQASCREIAKRLMRERVLTATGLGRWHPTVVNYMLKQTAYLGQLQFFRDEQEPVTIPVPTIVDEATWDAAQRQLQTNAHYAVRNNCRHQYLLRGLLRCECGRRLVGQTGHTKRGKREYSYYLCSRKDAWESATGEVCKAKGLPAPLIEPVIHDAIFGLFRKSGLLRLEYERQVAEQANPKIQADESKRLETELRRLAEKVDRLLELYSDGALAKETLNKKVAEVNGKRDLIQTELAAFHHREQDAEREAGNLASFEAFVAEIAKGLDNLTFEEEQELLRLVVDHATVRGNRVQIAVAIPLGEKPVSALRTPGESRTPRPRREKRTAATLYILERTAESTATFLIKLVGALRSGLRTSTS